VRLPADILLIEPMQAAIEARLDADYRVHRLHEADDKAAFLAPIASSIRAIVTGGGSGASVELVDSLPALEIITINGVGTDAVDLNHARQRGVRVTNTPDVLTDDVADLGIGLLIATARQMAVGDRFVRDGQWAAGGKLPLATKVTGKKLGVAGMGRIGRAFAKRAAAFDMPISYTGRKPQPDLPYRYEPDLVQLARDSEVLCVATIGGETTRGLINAEVLDALGPKGILINIARGSVVDEDALVAALVEGRLGGAGLDVFVDEPNTPEALWSMDNVVLQPHRASATIETRMAMGELVLTNLAAHFAGQTLATPVV
jgi:lactate dehydrogenase-like 2-hydroxyacid dehydrogenase